MRFNSEAVDDGGVDVDDATIRLEPTSDAPALARDFVAAHRDHLADGLVDDARLLVSELITNAVQHGRSAIVLRVRAAPPGIGIAVADLGDAIDVGEAPAQPPRTATSGRGLAIVDAVATSWGVDPVDPPPGKTVWFEIRA